MQGPKGPEGPPLRPIAGFEATAYAWRGTDIVWAGDQACTDHPRNVHRPWWPVPRAFDAARLRRGARCCIALVRATQGVAPCGLLSWLVGAPLPFPLQPAAVRFDALRDALARDDVRAFEAAALRVLGLGPGLTPSGDDFLGGIFFALAFAPRPGWAPILPALHSALRLAAAEATNVISAALLGDLMQGIGYRALHELLAALDDGQPDGMAHAVHGLLRIGATSGADLLAGVLVALEPAP